MNTTPPPSYQVSTSSPIDIAWLLNRVKGIILEPAATWQEVKGENHSVKDLYVKWIFIMAAIQPLCMMVATSFRSPILFIAQYVLQLAFLYVMAFVLNQIASKFEGKGALVDSLKLMVYSSTPAYVLGFLTLIPMGVVAILNLLSLYGIYLFYTGVTPVLGVPENKRLVFVIVSAVIFFIISMIMGAILFAVMGGAMIAAGAGTLPPS